MTDPKSHLPAVITIWVAPSPNRLDGWDAQLSVTNGMTLVELGAGPTALGAARNMVDLFQAQAVEIAIQEAQDRGPS